MIGRNDNDVDSYMIILPFLYNKINFIRQHYLFYYYIRLHVSTHQSVIFRPTEQTKSLALCAYWDPDMFTLMKYIKSQILCILLM